MALPPGVTAKTVTLGIGTFFDGTVVTGRATVVAPVNVVHTATNRPLYGSDMPRPFVDGQVSFDLCPTDAPGLNRVDWAYRLRVEVSGANTQPEVISFLLPTAGPDTVDLDGLVTVPSSAGIPISVDVLTAGDLDPLTAGFVADTDSQTALALRAAFVPKWKPDTAYALGEAVVNPSGQLVTANAAFTSGASYSASNWTVTAGGGASNALGTASNPVTDAAAARPTGLTSVWWQTAVLPTNFADADVWIDAA